MATFAGEEWDDFTGGLDLASPPGALAPGAARRLSGLRADAAGRLRDTGGERVLVPAGGRAVYDCRRYVSSSGVRRLVWVERDTAGAYSLKAIDEGSGAGTVSTFTGPGALQPGNTTFDTVQVADTVYVTNYNGRLVAWDGGDFTRFAGQTPPVNALVAADGGAGLLDSSVGDAYRYVYTVRRGGNPAREGNPSPASDPIDVTGKRVTLSGILSPADANPGDEVRVFRQGGLAGTFRLAFAFIAAFDSGTGALRDAATGAAPVDNVPDADLSLEEVLRSNLPPPLGLTVLVHHQNRLFGAGRRILSEADASVVIHSPGTLFFSRPGQPEAWGATDDGVDDDGGFLSVDRDTSDAILWLESTGSLLIIGRERSVYALYGDGFRSFHFDKRSNIGCAGPRAYCRADNRVYFLGADARVYWVGDEGSEPVDERIRPALRDLDPALLAGAVLHYHDGEVFVVAPVGTGAAGWALDLQTGAWREAEGSRYAALRLRSFPPPPGLPEDVAWGGKPQLLVCRTAGAGGGIVWADTPDAATQDLLYQRDILFGRRGERGRLLSLLVEGAMTPAASAADTVVAEVACGGQVYAFACAGTSGELLRAERLPPDLEGREATITLRGRAARFELHRLAYGFAPREAGI